MRSLIAVLRYARRYWMLGAVALSCMVVTGGLELVWPQFQRLIIDRCLTQGQYRLLPYFAMGILGLFIVRGFFMLSRNYLSELVAQRTIYDIRNALFDHIQRLSFSYHDQAETGQLISRTTSDVDALSTFIGGGMLNIVVNSIMGIGILILCLRMNFKLAIIAMSCMPFIAVTVLRWHKLVDALYTDLQNQIGKLTAAIQQNVMGIKVVKAFAREEFEIKKFEDLGMERFRLALQVTRIGAFLGPMLEFMAAVGTTFVLWYGGMQVLNGSLSLGELVVFNTYLAMMVGPVTVIAWIISVVQNAVAAADRVFEIFSVHKETHLRDGRKVLRDCKGHVEFRNVSLSYDDKHAALNNVSFEARPGEMVAIIGPTGSGKSSIINLLPRFYDVTDGAVMLDGVDIREYKLATLRENIGIVAQETFLFNTTVRENIAFSRPNTHLDDVIEVAKAANIHDFISSLPDGYETVVGERGMNLSGGQKQRLSIARALLKNPPILILDDSTSALDMETELLVQQALASLMEARTTFVIAQRISTVKRADRIIVLNQGEIVEMGSHDELADAGGLYSEIYRIQLSGLESGSAAVVPELEEA